MKGSQYFPHDYDARQDIKIVRLMASRGVEGYGIYWAILEELYKAGGKLPLVECESIAFALHLDCKCIASVVQEFDLFKNDGQFFWSESVNRRVEVRQNISIKRQNAAKKRWDDANAMQVQSKTQKTDAIAPTNIEIIKDNNTLSNDKGVGEKRTRFVPPTLEEVKAYVNEKGYTNVDPEKFFLFYESKGWFVGKNKMKSWHAAVGNWAKTERQTPGNSGAARRQSLDEQNKQVNDLWK